MLYRSVQGALCVHVLARNNGCELGGGVVPACALAAR